MKLVLVRHGQSLWNLENKFTGWTDIELSEQGILEAIEAGRLLKEKNYVFTISFSSYLKRAQKTLDIILKEMEIDIPKYYSWRLNERHYGALQGLNKEETAQKYGQEQVRLWRRSVSVRPPLLEIDDMRNPEKDPKYKGINNLPRGENLLDTEKRVVDYWESDIKKYLLDNKDVLIVAHGNSIRALIKYLDNLSEDEIMSIEIPTGKPLCYELDKNLKPIKKYYVER